jgi:G6PDH family F420-dependent oxidoreductase
VRIGFFLATEEFTPRELLAQARAAEEAGFHGLWISDHFHPWNDEQGQSPFVWTVLGALSQVTSRGPVTTAVTCPTVRIHPVVIAQAAATTAAMFGDRFRFGVGSGEALNEHVLGDPWPEADVRLEMLEEAVELIRDLWRGGVVNHRGRHYRAQHARLYTLPASPPPIPVSGFGPKSVDLAARIGDGYVITMPDADLIGRFRSNGGGDKVVQAGIKVCWGPDEAGARRTVRRLWPNEALPGELAQVLPTPEHFEQATELVTEDMLAEAVPCGPDLDRHLAAMQEFADVGVDELYIHQIGGPGDDFFSKYAREILGRFDG